ncbi:MAG TPA: trigger factor [Bacteroidales bacterium]|nr:trigger factor [Bacteroidales bacterium]
MNITRENIDELNAVLKVKVVKDDYEEKMNDVLKDYKKKANIKGFRPGKVPFGLIKKMYGSNVKLEEINKIVSGNISKYITEEKLEILGDLLPKTDDNQSIDIETQEEFEFSFEIGLAPEFEVSLSARNKVPYYKIKIDKKLRGDFLDNYRRRFGQYEDAEEVTEEDMLRGDIVKLSDDGNTIDETLRHDSSMSVKVIKDEPVKKDIIGRKAGDSVDFDIRKSFPNDHEIAGLLQTDHNKLDGTDGVYRFTINAINRFKMADVNQELFDRVYGEGKVQSEEEFMKKLDEEISNNLAKESDYKLNLDTRNMVISKTDFELPEEFLKKWLMATNKDITEDQVEKDFEDFVKDLRWQLIRNKVAKENEIKVEEEDMLKEAKEFTRLQFQQYGIYNAEDSQLESYAKEILKKEEDYRRIADKVIDDKVLVKIKEEIKIDNKKVSTDEFNKLFPK